MQRPHATANKCASGHAKALELEVRQLIRAPRLPLLSLRPSAPGLTLNLRSLTTRGSAQSCGHSNGRCGCAWRVQGLRRQVNALRVGPVERQVGATCNALGLEVHKQLVESVERTVLILQDRFGDAAAAKTLECCMLHRVCCMVSVGSVAC